MATLMYDRADGGRGQAKSMAAIIAIVAAIVSFILSARGREFLALGSAIVAVGAGLLGGLRALSPRVSGGILSMAAVVLGAIAMIVAVLALFV
ncbi:MAG TPA: hypothetical protein VFB66_07635 [Tepidisphaeraceae bacterium]|nr:hypothetical protein [Tepidisphaeraceae bacterium]